MFLNLSDDAEFSVLHHFQTTAIKAIVQNTEIANNQLLQDRGLQDERLKISQPNRCISGTS